VVAVDEVEDVEPEPVAESEFGPPDASELAKACRSASSFASRSVLDDDELLLVEALVDDVVPLLAVALVDDVALAD